MISRWGRYVLLAVVGAVVLLYVAFATGAIAPYLGGYDPGAEEYDYATVTVYDAETDEELGRVDAAVADTFAKRYVGLSETEALPEDRGMLFVHDDPGNHTYVMRNMSFGIDILFVDADGRITAIHEAPAPAPDEDGESQQYRGYGQYVLEVNYGWSADRDVEVGDRVEIDR